MDDLELLKAYADHRNQEAFAQLVRCHSPWLYAAARRQLSDAHLAEVGRLLGVSEEAARKRVERAVGKLREVLAAKGVEAETVGLSGMLLAHAGEGGPADLTEMIMTGVGQGVASSAPAVIAKGATKMMVLAKVRAMKWNGSSSLRRSL